MLVDVRYHLASLIGVFLSLGLGILIGTSISSDGRLLREQVNIIDTIEAQLGQLRDERTRIKAELAQTSGKLAAYQSYVEKTLPQLVSGRLDGLAFAVVGLSEDSLTKSVQSTLHQAGANITGVVQLGELALLHRGGLLASTGQLDSQLTKMLVATLQGNGITGQSVWEGVRWVQPATGKADGVVVVSSDQSTDLLRRVAGALGQGGLQVTAAAPGAGWSKALRSQGLSAIEGVDMPLGLLTLVDQLAVN